MYFVQEDILKIIIRLSHNITLVFSSMAFYPSDQFSSRGEEVWVITYLILFIYLFCSTDYFIVQMLGLI